MCIRDRCYTLEITGGWDWIPYILGLVLFPSHSQLFMITLVKQAQEGNSSCRHNTIAYTKAECVSLKVANCSGYYYYIWTVCNTLICIMWRYTLTPSTQQYTVCFWGYVWSSFTSTQLCTSVLSCLCVLMAETQKQSIFSFLAASDCEDHVLK